MIYDLYIISISFFISINKIFKFKIITISIYFVILWYTVFQIIKWYIGIY